MNLEENVMQQIFSQCGIGDPPGYERLEWISELFVNLSDIQLIVHVIAFGSSAPSFGWSFNERRDPIHNRPA
jgi:hypothetical protein